MHKIKIKIPPHRENYSLMFFYISSIVVLHYFPLGNKFSGRIFFLGGGVGAVGGGLGRKILAGILI